MTDQNLTTSPEVFKPVPGFPGYEISNQGRARSYHVAGQQVLAKEPQRFLKTELNRGYYRITLSKDGTRYHRTIHQLVLETFIGPCPLDCEGCHADGNCTNNFLENLSWGTKSKNSLDSIQHGTHVGLTHKGMGHPFSKLTDDQILQIRKLYAHGHPRKDIAKMFGVAPSNIGHIIHRRSWTHLP